MTQEAQFERSRFADDAADHEVIAHHALHREFLAVAVIRPGRQFVVYGLPVEGMNHRREANVDAVSADGCKLGEHVARALFGWLIEEAEANGWHYVS